MGNVLQNILVPAAAAWGEIESENQDLTIKILERVLEHYQDDVLAAAFDDLAATWVPRYKLRWPVAAAFKKACDDYIERTTPKAAKPDPKFVEDDPATKARMDALAKRAIANMKLAKPFGPQLHAQAVEDLPDAKPGKQIAANRDFYEGRRSAMGFGWTAPTLAEHIARQDAAKQHGDE